MSDPYILATGKKAASCIHLPQSLESRGPYVPQTSVTIPDRPNIESPFAIEITFFKSVYVLLREEIAAPPADPEPDHEAPENTKVLFPFKRFAATFDIYFKAKCPLALCK